MAEEKLVDQSGRSAYSCFAGRHNNRGNDEEYRLSHDETMDFSNPVLDSVGLKMSIICRFAV